MTTYDDIHAIAAKLEPPATHGHLNVEWVLADRLAIGRDSDNRHLLVLGGPPVKATVESVERALMAGTWFNETGGSIGGTLLRLHAGDQFLVAATTIAVELLRRGLGDRPVVDVFPEVEGFIELVIRRVLLPHEALLGLVGELLVLDHLLDVLLALPEDSRPDPVGLWQGHSRKSRDFRLNRLGIEVKTTSHPSSRHHIGGLDQVEPRTVDGEETEALFLASVGLREDASAPSRFSVAGLTESILGKLDADIGTKFLDQLRKYGPDDCMGYDHATMADWEPYARGFAMTFTPRLYDMSDPNVRVIRRKGLQEHFPFVAPEAISFIVELPDEVPGSYGANPRTGLPTELARLVKEHAR